MSDITQQSSHFPVTGVGEECGQHNASFQTELSSIHRVGCPDQSSEFESCRNQINSITYEFPYNLASCTYETNHCPGSTDQGRSQYAKDGILSLPQTQKWGLQKREKAENRRKMGEGDNGSDVSNERVTKDPTRKQSQMAVTLKWLTENYERADGVCLPRCVLYSHYLDLCKRQSFSPAGAATFGKIIRQRFPKLTTRRLGTRGQSKYHYYGIGIKESSIYYHAVYTGKGLTRFSGTKVKTEGSSRKFSLNAKTGTILPPFPEVNDLLLAEDIDVDKMETFLLMYRTHCQRILDTVIGANFNEIQTFLLHFWQGLPEHIMPLLSYNVVTDVIAYCDSILYKVIMDVLIPTTIQELPDGLCGEMIHFARKLPVWMSCCLEDVPNPVEQKKTQVLLTFTRSLRRQISFVQLAQASRVIFSDADMVERILKELAVIDFEQICVQAGVTDVNIGSEIWTDRLDYLTDFKDLLKKQAPIEAVTEWMDNVIDLSILKVQPDSSVQSSAAEFLLQWTVVSSLVMRDLTLNNATSFSAVHVLGLMLEEYIFLVIETEIQQTTEKQLQENMREHLKNTELPLKIGLSIAKSSSLSSRSRKRKSDDSITDVPLPASSKTSLTVKYPTVDTKSKQEPENCARRSGFSTTGKPDYSMNNLMTTYTTPVLENNHDTSFKYPEHGSYDGTYISRINMHSGQNERNYPNMYEVSRVHDDMAPHHYVSSTLTSASAFNMATYPVQPPLWSGSYSETLPAYSCYGKYPSAYDAYGHSFSLLDMNADNYQGVNELDSSRSAFGSTRTAFESTRAYYCRHHGNFSGAMMNYVGFGPAAAPPYSPYHDGRSNVARASQRAIPQTNLTPIVNTFSKTLVTPFR